MSLFFLDILDEDLKRSVLASGQGRRHLLETGNKILNRASTAGEHTRALLGLGLDMLLAAWELAPLDGVLANHLLSLHRSLPFLDRESLAAITASATSFQTPDSLEKLRALTDQRDYAGLEAFLAQGYTTEPDNLFWIGQMLDLAALMNSESIWDAALNASWPNALQPHKLRFSGDRAFLNKDHETALKLYAQAQGGPARLRLAACLLANSKQPRALEILRSEIRRRPWQVNTTLTAHDLITGMDQADSQLPGSVCVQLYTFNKADDLNNTLTALAPSLADNISVTVLNNGSTDHTDDILHVWKDRMGDRLSLLTMPANIGAPAARNWLKHLPASGEFDYVAYLDDDALLPEDWQEHLHTAVRAYPEAGVWGCRVTDASHPNLIQHADLHLKDTGKPDETHRGFAFAFYDACNQDMDFCQCSYTRPCHSVTGCFHLFRSRDLTEGPDFDLRFSPSQFDDLDHDLQLCLQGKAPVYHGHLCVRHCCKSGRLTLAAPAARGNMSGNVLKLETKYERAEFLRLLEADTLRMETDFRRKAQLLADTKDSSR